jgi:hypothetical protein
MLRRTIYLHEHTALSVRNLAKDDGRSQARDYAHRD